MVGGSYFRDSVQGKSPSAKATFAQRPGQSEQLDRGCAFQAVGTARAKAPGTAERPAPAAGYVQERQAGHEGRRKGPQKGFEL